jgi:hypothetical protein
VLAQYGEEKGSKINESIALPALQPASKKNREAKRYNTF